MYPGERFNSYSHLAGLVLALSGAYWLLQKAWRIEDSWQIVGLILFSLTMVLLYTSSTLYHSSRGKRKKTWCRVDHCSIYLLIAGTVTPFVLRASMSVLSASLLTLIWLFALYGVWREIRTSCDGPPSVYLYIALGWLGVLTVLLEWSLLNSQACALLLIGAGLYTGGTLFYSGLIKIRHAHGTWHLFVVGGTACHFFSIGAQLG